MAVLAYSFYGNKSLWVRYYRRGLASEIKTTRSSSPTLYGMMLRSVAPRGGGPGSRWTHFRASSRHWTTRSSPNSSGMDNSRSSTNIYLWSHLSYEGASPLTTFTISTTETTCATGMALITSSSRDLLYQSRAATKTDALSGVLI